MSFHCERARLISVVGRRWSARRLRHSVAVADTAEALARCHAVDADRAWMAGLMHDYARELSLEESVRLAGEYGLGDKAVGATVALLHAPLAAALLPRELGIEDAEVLQAVARHTTGAAAMTPLDMVVYLADAIEPGRRFPGVTDLRLLARDNLEEAMRASLQGTVTWLQAGGRPVDNRTMEALDWFATRPRL